MWTVEVFNERAFRLALGFALTISVATAAAFAFIYLQVSRADVDQVSAILVDEAAKSAGDSEADLRRALELRLTRDIRRLDFVALIEAFFCWGAACGRTTTCRRLCCGRWRSRSSRQFS